MKSSSKILPAIGIFVLAVFLVFVFSRVLEMRFSSGTMYPHYSSQRTDPLGAQAIYDSFDRLDAFTISRNFERYEKLTSLDDNTALILLGVQRRSLMEFRAKDDSKVLEAVKENGTRLIITVNPELVPVEFTPNQIKEKNDWFEKRRQAIRKKEQERAEKTSKERKEAADSESDKKSEEDSGLNAEKETPVESKNDSGSKADDDEGDEKKDDRDEVEKKLDDWLENDEELEKETLENFGPTLFARWGIGYADFEAFQRPEAGWEPRISPKAKSRYNLKVFPNWKSHIRFEVDESVKDQWDVIATVDNKPVVLEKKLGKGSIVLASDSYFASNESLHNGAPTEFLLWLLGGKRNLILDETVHGSSVSSGAMKLIRRYRLHGLFVGLFVFVAIWAWRSATSLAPGSVEIDGGLVDQGSAVSGEESGSGMVRLLRRSIPPKDLLSKCAEIWKSSRTNALKPEEETAIADVISEHRDNPKSLGSISAYRRIAGLLKKKV